MSGKTKLTKEEANLSAAVMLAIELDSNFKLYSYRIIGADQFIEKTKELIQFYKSNTKAHQ